jgi:methylmalonyl-CoA mutase
MTRRALHRDADLMDSYGPGSDIVKCAADVLRLLGHNMSPKELSEAAE